MGVLYVIAEIIRDLRNFVRVIFTRRRLMALVVTGSTLTDDKRIQTAFGYRVSATASAGAQGISIEPIPGFDVLYEVGISIAMRQRLIDSRCSCTFLACIHRN